MSKFTDFLNLFKWNTADDSEEEFDIDKALNDNWDKLDNKAKQHIEGTAFVHPNATQFKDGFISKEDKEKLDTIEKDAQENVIEEIQKNGKIIEIKNKILNIVLKKDDVGLDNVDNTSDLNKPISNLQKKEFNKKVDKEEGKGLSSNDFTDEDKAKLIPAGGTTGQVLTKKSDTDNDVEWTNQTGQGGATGDTLPIGAIIPYSSNNVPKNWLLANGQEVSRTEYNHLFAIIGTIYGEGDGSTTFNLPNLCGKTIVGLDENDADFNEIGKTLGEKKHKLTLEELPAHKPTTEEGEAIACAKYAWNSTGDNFKIGNEGGYEIKQVGTIGGDKTHNNIQPSVVQNYIIKAKQSAGLVATVVDSLDSTSTTDALSAKQGKELNEKIEKRNNYSTDEQVVGTWIDGKQIYRKTITQDGTSLAEKQIYTVDISSFNINSVISMQGMTYQSGNGYWRNLFNSYAYDDTSVTEFSGAWTTPTELRIRSRGIAISKFYVTLEYTKTTD